MILVGELDDLRPIDDILIGFPRIGWYGIGQPTAEGPIRLKAATETRLCKRRNRRELGRFSRAIVNSQYSLHNATASQLAMYENAIVSRSGFWFQPRGDLARVTRFAVYTVKRQAQKRTGGKESEISTPKPVSFARKGLDSEQ